MPCVAEIAAPAVAVAIEPAVAAAAQSAAAVAVEPAAVAAVAAEPAVAAADCRVAADCDLQHEAGELYRRSACTAFSFSWNVEQR